MKNKKQSAVGRRMAKSSLSSVSSITNNSIQTVSNTLADVVLKLDNATYNLNQVTQISESTSNQLLNQLDPENDGSVVARLVDLENNVGGGGGIDPTDPSQPVLIYDTFLIQDNGNFDGTGGIYQSYPPGNPQATRSRHLSPFNILTKESDSEVGHLGVISCTVNGNPAYMSMGHSPGIDLVDWDSFNRMYVILKPVTTTSNYVIEVGLFDNIHTPTKGVYASGARGGSWTPTAKDTGTTTGTTKAFANDWITIKIEKLSATSAVIQFNDEPEVILSINIPSGYLVPGIRGLGDPFTFESFDFKLDFFSIKIGADSIPVPGGTTLDLISGLPNYTESKTFTYDVNDNLEEVQWNVNGVAYTQDFYYNLDGTLNYTEWVRDGNTYRKTFTWNLDGTLASAIITEL